MPRRPSKLLPKVLLRVVPPCILLLLVIWVVTFQAVQSTVKNQLDERLGRDAAHGGAAISERFKTLTKAVAAIAENDLIVNSLIDLAGRDDYLPTLFQSMRLAGPEDAGITLTNYRGRVVASNKVSVTYENAPWLEKVMRGEIHTRLSAEGLLIAYPVRYGGRPEGTLVYEASATALPALFAAAGNAEATAVVSGDGTIMYSSDPRFADRAGKLTELKSTDWVWVGARIEGLPKLVFVAAENPKHAFAPVERVRQSMLAAVCLSVIAVVIGIFATAYSATIPIRSFIDVVGHVRATRELGSRMVPSGAAEFHTLASSFNQMLEQIESATTSRDELVAEVTERKKAIDELNRFKNVFDSTLDMIFMFDRKTLQFQYINKGALALTGYSSSELLRMKAYELRLSTTEEEYRELLAPLISGDLESLQVETVHHRKDGGEYPAEIRIQLISTGDADTFVAVVRDVTERKRLENYLRDSETSHRAIIQMAADGVIIIDTSGTVKIFNPACEKMFGYNAGEVIGRNIKMLMPPPFHDEHDSYLNKYFETGDAKVVGYQRELVGRREDGTTFPMEISVGEFDVGQGRRFVGVIRDITERKKADNLKNEFVSTVSHELRTPLTSIMGSLGLVRGGAAGEVSDAALRMVTIAHDNCERLVRLINDILDIEKIESGNMEFEFKPVEVGSLLDQAVEANRSYSKQLDVRLKLLNDVGPAFVSADVDRLSQVITNLISNASKFSPGGGEVIVSAHIEGPTVRIAVSDEGPGIPSEFEDRIFEKFAQADSSDRRQRGGTGLGLAICKEIVDRHDGQIAFATKVGEGTTFYFDLPVLGVLTDEVAEDDEAAEDMAASTRPLPNRILVCEDDPEVASVLAILLEQAGYKADLAFDAESAKRMLSEAKYAAMTLDLVLPDQDGISMIRELRADPQWSDLPIVVVSMKASEGAKELNGDAIGIIDWLDKPIDSHRLLAAMNQVRTNALGRQLRILHVEDDPDIVDVVAALLGTRADVVGARDISDAKRLIEKRDFDVVLLDLALPDGSGETLIPFIAEVSGSAVPIVIFSASESPAEISRSVAASLVKSRTTNEALVETVLSVLSKFGHGGGEADPVPRVAP